MPELFDNPQINRLKDRVLRAQDENEQLLLIKSLFNVIQNSSKSVVDRLEEGLQINNFDEIHAALRNEFNRNAKSLRDALSDLKLSNEEWMEIIASLKRDSEKRIDGDIQTIRIKKPRDKVMVTNFEDLVIPGEILVGNLSDLQKYFDSLAEVIKSTFNINIPTPEVTVSPPEIRIPETNVSIPETDLRPIVKALDSNLNKIKTNSKERPLAVRLSDGRQFIDKITALLEDQKIAFQGFNENVRLRDKNGNVINAATEESVSVPGSIGTGNKDVSSAGTAVQLAATATACKKVYVTGKAANTGKIYYGGASVDSSNGAFLYAGQTVEIIINDVSKIYIDADTNSEGVQYTYVS